MNSFDRPIICTVPKKRVSICDYETIVNDRFFEMSFCFKKVTSGLPFYVSQPSMDRSTRGWIMS